MVFRAALQMPLNSSSNMSPSGEGVIDPLQVRFSQNSISSKFQDGTSIQDLVVNLKVGKVSANSIPPIRIVEKNGLIYTLDNRRLKVFQEVNMKIRYQKLDKIPDNEIFKFTTINEGKAIIIRGE